MLTLPNFCGPAGADATAVSMLSRIRPCAARATAKLPSTASAVMPAHDSMLNLLADHSMSRRPGRCPVAGWPPGSMALCSMLTSGCLTSTCCVGRELRCCDAGAAACDCEHHVGDRVLQLL